MLSHEENELLTRTGPGTPMGNMYRRFWMHAPLPSELPTPDSDPIRFRILGEDLVAFRDTDGKVGFVTQHCPHRGASLFFGRNEVDAGVELRPGARGQHRLVARRLPAQDLRPSDVQNRRAARKHPTDH